MAKRGRPSEYTLETAQRICDALCEPAGLDVIVQRPGFPSAPTIARWLDQQAEFRSAYARAREIQAHLYAAQTVTIADKVRHGEKTKRTTCMTCGGAGRAEQCEACGGTGRHPERDTWRCGKCKCRKCGGSGEITETTTGDMVERSRLMFDARKWMSAKLAPRKYGDRIELANDPDNPLPAPRIIVEFMARRELPAAPETVDISRETT